MNSLQPHEQVILLLNIDQTLKNSMSQETKNSVEYVVQMVKLIHRTLNISALKAFPSCACVCYDLYHFTLSVEGPTVVCHYSLWLPYYKIRIVWTWFIFKVDVTKLVITYHLCKARYNGKEQWSHQVLWLVQERCNTIVLAMELRLSCTYPLKWCFNGPTKPCEMMWTHWSILFVQWHFHSLPMRWMVYDMIKQVWCWDDP